MQITRQLLLEQRQRAEQRHHELIAKANAEAGAISTLDMLLTLEGQPEPTPESPPVRS